MVNATLMLGTRFPSTERLQVHSLAMNPVARYRSHEMDRREVPAVGHPFTVEKDAGLTIGRGVTFDGCRAMESHGGDPGTVDCRL